MTKTELQKRLKKKYANQQYEDAKVLADDYICRYPDAITYGQHVAFSNIFLNVGQFNKALEQVEKAYAIDQKRVDAVQQSFWVYFASNAVDKARTVLDVLNHMDDRETHSEIYSRWKVLLEEKDRKFKVITDLLDAGEISLDLTKSRSHEVISAVIRALCECFRIDEALDITAQIPKTVFEGSLNLQFSRAKISEYRGDISDAVLRYEQIIKKFGYPEAQWNRALALLSIGDLSRGWEEFENRWGWKDYPSSRWTISASEWSGEELCDRVILVLPEQGIGDELMYLTQLPVLEYFSPREVVIQVSPKIVSVVSDWYPMHKVIPSPEDSDLSNIPAYEHVDFYVNVASLSLYKIRQKIPLKQRFLDYSARGSSRKNHALSLGLLRPGITVGIAWRSSSYFGARASQYLNYKAIDAIINSAPKGVVFVNLQYQLNDDEIEFVENCGSIFQPDENLFDDVEACAEVIAMCDIVICPATIVRQLAGLTATPCISWGLDPHWSHLGKEEYPWYPNIKIVKCARDWDSGTLVYRLKKMIDRLPSLFRRA